MKAPAPHPPAVTVGAALRRTLHELETTSPSPRLDAEVLLMHACGIGRSELLTRRETALTDEQLNRLQTLLARRRQGEPVAYLTGTREFWSLELNVTPATLIPRPETELLVEKALARIPRDVAWTIADLGTGSGAIALAIAQECPRCRVIATDSSGAALAVARANAEKFRLVNIEFREGDWFAALAGETCDTILSNPPYIRAGDPHLQQGDLRFEPVAALVSGADGLDAIRLIARQARDFLKPGGRLLFEHGWDQAGPVGEILRQLGWRDIVSHVDLAGHARVADCLR